MKLIKKVIGIILICFGAFILFGTFMGLAGSKGETVMMLIVGLVFIVPGLLIFRTKKQVKGISEPESVVPDPDPETTHASEPEINTVNSDPEKETSKEPEYERLKFRVTGISQHEKEIIDKLLIENDEWDMSKKELIEYDMINTRIYRYYGLSEGKLIPEPNNPYDPNAIKVIAEGVHIGYVPSEMTNKVKKILSTKDYLVGCNFIGGEYKILYEDYDDLNDKNKYTVERDKLNIGCEVTIKYNK